MTADDYLEVAMGVYLGNIGVEEDKALGISPLEDEVETVQI